MRKSRFSSIGLLGSLVVPVLVSCASAPNNVIPPVDSGMGMQVDVPDPLPPENDVPNAVCVDSDNDGIADALEAGDSDMDGMPNAQDMDSDNDGYVDRIEASGAYPGVFPQPRPLVCGRTPADCDMDGTPNFRDLDSDNDGLTDAEENTARSNPCAEDTDNDGVPDLIESVAMSDPTNAGSRPPADSLYVTLPYHPPAEMGRHEYRSFHFQTRIRAADVMFVVDTTGSMRLTIEEVQRSLMARIIPGIVNAIGPGGNLRFGLAGHGDFGAGGSNYAGNVTVFQKLTRDVAAVQMATNGLRAEGGGDEPESQTTALHALISGAGFPVYNGTAIRNVDPVRDCNMGPDDLPYYGWGCFQEGRVPIVVLMSDANWHNGPGLPNFYTDGIPVYNDLRAEMVRRSAFFIGISVRTANTYMQSVRLATDTMTFNGAGQPIAFMGQPDTLANQIVEAITTVAGQSRQDISTRTDPDRMERRLTAPHTTAEFLKAVAPFAANPEMPSGYISRDATTFYGVSPDCVAEFEVDFYNDFQPGGPSAQLYRATIVVLGRSGSEVDRREVFVIVPSANAGAPVG